DSPVLVSLEVGERDPAWRFQRVLILRVNNRGDEDGEHCNGCRNDGKASDRFRGGACFSLLFLPFLRHRFRHKFRHCVFSFTKKFSKPDQRAFRTIAIKPAVRPIDNVSTVTWY